jgi:hypothetical protein
MPKSCIICSAVASPELQLQYCDQCQSAMYCSRACQRIDWKKQHKKICKFLNVGHGDMQMRTEEHTSRQAALKEQFERVLSEEAKQFFKLFEESTFEGSRAAAQKMNKYAKSQIKENQMYLVYHSLNVLVRSSNLEMLSWPNSPLLVMLQFVDPNELFGGEETSATLLRMLAQLLDPSEYSTHENQLILAKQLIEHGANVNALSRPQRETPLHMACYSGIVTNLDFIELLLYAGADPNAQDHMGRTPLMYTIASAPGAAKFLLNWPTTDANIATRDGVSFLTAVRSTITEISSHPAHPDNHDKVHEEFLLKQWREIEEMLVERGTADTDIEQRASSTHW